MFSRMEWKNKKMIKKLFSFVCCLVPFGANAVVVGPENIGDSFVSTDGSAWLATRPTDQTITISDTGVNSIQSPHGFSITNNMYVGATSDQGSQTGNLYILNTVNGGNKSFTIESNGNIYIGEMLQVLDGWNLGFKSNDTTPSPFLMTTGGAITNNGTLTFEDISTFSSNSKNIDNNGTLYLDAQNVATGTINTSVILNIKSDTNVIMQGLISKTGATSTTITANDGISSNGTIQNGTGSMILSTSGALAVTGNFENSGTLMQVTGIGTNETTGNTNLAGVMTISGTMKNDSQNGTMRLNTTSLIVSGGSETEYSFVNNGNFYANVYSQTHFENGINLSGMDATNTFSLETEILTFGTNVSADASFGAFANHLNNFNLVVNSGMISAGTILNGINASGVQNANANMNISSDTIIATTVNNAGKNMTLTSTGGIIVFDQIIGAANSNTNLIAQDSLNTTGSVSNAGKMLLNASDINLASVSNSGAGSQLAIESLTDKTGYINISGDVTNAIGTTTIHAKDVTVGGTITNNSGTTTLYGSDTSGGAVQIGGINAKGGTTNINALAGSATVNNSLNVAATGTLNLGTSLYDMTVGGDIYVGGDVVLGNATTGAGNMNINAYGAPVILSASNGNIKIDGGINATDNTQSRTIQMVSNEIIVGTHANAQNKGNIIFGNTATMTSGTSTLDIDGNLNANDGGSVEIYSNATTAGAISVNSKLIAHGASITANSGNIDIDGNLLFDDTTAKSGLIVKDTADFTLATTATDADINIGAASIGDGNKLTMESADTITIDGTLVNNGITNINAASNIAINEKTTNSNTLDIDGTTLSMGDINNTGAVNLNASDGEISVGNITTNNSLEISATDTVTARAISQSGGIMTISGPTVSADSLVIDGATGTQANIDTTTIDITGNIRVAGDLVQSSTPSGMLNINATEINAANLNVGNDFIIGSGDATYDIATNINVTGDIISDTNSIAEINAGNTIAANDLTNSGTLTLNATNGISLNNVVNSGALTMDSGNSLIDIATLTMNSGNLFLDGAGLYMDGAIATNAKLYQGYTGALSDKDINITATDYVITTSNMVVSDINQNGSLTINTSDIDIGGDIIATDLRFVAQKLPDGTTDGQIVNIDGSVSGNVSFMGLQKMSIGGNYTFNDNSSINAIILPYAAGAGSSDRNYWATVSLAPDNTLGKITNAADATALITVNGKFETNLNTIGSLTETGALGKPQIGINITDAIDQGTAILLLQANEGITELATKIRNLNVNFCNADGSVCYNYFDSLTQTNTNSEDGLPAYISVRDMDTNGTAESMYIVFDPRFGGPVLIENTKIQPIVARQPDYTTGEYVSAGALDNLIAGQLNDKGFYNRTPIEVIPLIFDGTNIEELMNQLYNRMEYYVETSDGKPLARFSRLVQAREIEQIAGTIALNEHTTFRSFEDRMFDEFIWNRHRNLNKAWLDVDYGMFYQNIADNKHTDGNRFSVSGGFDWQESNTLILGLTGHVSHTSSASADKMDLSYANIVENGHVNIDVDDTNIGVGGYLMKTLGEKSRLYGNAFLDIHFFDISRAQNFVDHIDGDGHALSLLTEWGLMHDILNQYFVGNIYARAGYNFGFDVKEKIDGDDYMRMESDGYFVLTPGYSLIAQKRIYPSAWFQIRPYASIGIEYDLLGAPDYAKYKFVQSEHRTKYDIDIDPLWANIGGGIEMLSANGIQIGLDYRYQYNSDIQLHNIKVSGSYRF